MTALCVEADILDYVQCFVSMCNVEMALINISSSN